jgi:hypothetical protein
MKRLSISACGVRVALGVLAGVATVSLISPSVGLSGGGNEFRTPNWAQLPTPSAFNATPACPLTAENNYDCEVPDAALPARDPNNIETFLNSAYWPAEKRPDVETYAIQKYGYDYKDCSSLLPHYCFLVDAEAVGYPVDHTPRAGDLWVAPCSDLIWLNGVPADCGGDNGWYLGYVEQVFPDGSFIQSWGGSLTPADSGLALTWMSGEMDANADFIHLMPLGTTGPPIENTVSIDVEFGNNGTPRVVVSSDAPDPMLTLTSGARKLTLPLRRTSNGYVATLVSVPPDAYQACAFSGGGGTRYRAARQCTNVIVSQPTISFAQLTVVFRRSSAVGEIRVKGPLLGVRAAVSFFSGNICAQTTTQCAGLAKQIARRVVLKPRIVFTLPRPPRGINEMAVLILDVPDFVRNERPYRGFDQTKTRLSR